MYILSSLVIAPQHFPYRCTIGFSVLAEEMKEENRYVLYIENTLG
jgi:hypothetical protein